MGKENQQAVYAFLVALATKQGYVTFADIMDCADKWHLPISSVDWISSEIAMRGILIYDEAPTSTNNGDSEEVNDYAQSDYESVFQKTIQLEPSLAPLITDIRNITPPQFKEVSQLKYQVREGNAFARKRMIEMHLRVAVKIALQRTEMFNMDIVDAFGFACIGLITAVDHYDPDINGAFSSYASLWMLQNVSREQPTQNPHIYFPVHKKEAYFAIYPQLKERGCTKCAFIMQCVKINELIYEKTECTDEQIRELLLALAPPYSLEILSNGVEQLDDVVINHDMALCHCLIDAYGFDEIVDANISRASIAKALSCLKEREQDIIIARYGLYGHREKTLEEIGQDLRLTRERVRQIEVKALRKLKHPTRKKKLTNPFE